MEFRKVKPMRLLPVLAGLAGAALLAPSAFAQSVEIGTLTCRQTDRTNLIIFSDASYACSFNPTEGANERYSATVEKLGVDLSTSKVETMVWYVFAPSNAKPGALEGVYVGASADAALGVGAGARVLVGGFENSFTLQPASVFGTEGVGLAVGIEEFRLKKN